MSQQMVRAHLFLSAGAAAPGDRAPARRYEFAHALHHQVIYEQIPVLRRQRLHLRVAEALESASGERLPEVAPELSVHFEQGGEPRRAAKYLRICVARAQQRQAPHGDRVRRAGARSARARARLRGAAPGRARSAPAPRRVAQSHTRVQRARGAGQLRARPRPLRERGPRAPALRDHPRRLVRADERLDVMLALLAAVYG